MSFYIIVHILLFSIFIVLLCFLKKLSGYLDNANNNGLWSAIEKLLPIEQVQEFKQLFYLLFAGLLFVDLYYLLIINTSSNYIWSFVLFDFIVSVLAGVYIFDKKKKLKTLILLITLAPLTGYSLTGYIGSIAVPVFIGLEILHCLGIIFIIIHSVQDFKLYSDSNTLGYTILLLYIIVFICVFLSTYFKQMKKLKLIDAGFHLCIFIYLC